MMNTQSYSTPFKLKAAPMIVGAVLLGTGSLIGIAGMIVGGHAIMSGARRWFWGLAEQAPQAAAKPKWGQQAKVDMPAGSQPMQGNGARARSVRA